MKFHIIIPLFDSENWIEDNIRMIRSQTYRNFKCIIMDDSSRDNSVLKARSQIENDPRFELHRNPGKRFALGSAMAGVQKTAAQAEDVILVVDGDDRLAHENVLQRLSQIYATHGCWMTYGSYGDGGRRDKACRPFPQSVVKANRFRHCNWVPVHLRTFKYKLLRYISPDAFTISDKEVTAFKRRALFAGRLRTWYKCKSIMAADLVDPTGRFVRRGCDKALIYPLLELCGAKSHFVDEILYHFNSYEKTLQYGASVVHQRWYTRCIRSIIEHKPKYQPLSSQRIQFETKMRHLAN